MFADKWKHQIFILYDTSYFFYFYNHMDFQKKTYVFETGVDYNFWNLYHTKITTTESYSSLILGPNC